MNKRSFTAVVFAALAALAVGVPSAQAATAQPFADQARASGLSGEQASSLQQKVNTNLKELGGTQVAANAIDLNGTGVLVMTVPGESKVRTMARSAAVRPETTGTCYSGDMCVWQLNGRTGDFMAKYLCNSAVNFPSSWLTTHGGVYQGSYWNHQTGGAHAYFYSGVNATGSLNYSPPVGSPTNRAWGAPVVDRSFLACK